ncbi:MAG: hypothetical protein ACI4QM_01100 [Alphaproteobacteria bacterium]
MKRLLVLSVALLSGCVPAQKEYTIIRETSRPATIEPVQRPVSVTQAPVTQPVQPVTTLAVQPMMQPVAGGCSGTNGCINNPAPTYFAGTYTTKPQQYTTTQQIAYQQPTCGGQVICGQNLATTLGTQNVTLTAQPIVQQMPAQTITMPAVQMPTQQIPAVGITGMMADGQMVQTEVVYETQALPVQQMPTLTDTQNAVIILQHPANRDLVKCSFGDANCLIAYEAQGYVQLRNTPHFAGYNAVLSDSDYPTGGVWRDNNNIPRW